MSSHLTNFQTFAHNSTEQEMLTFFEECEAEIAFWKLRFESQNDEILQYKQKLINEAQEKDEMQGYCKNMVEMNKTLLDKTAFLQEENMELLEKIRNLSINYQELLNENSRIGLKFHESDEFTKNNEVSSQEIENLKDNLREKERIIKEMQTQNQNLKNVVREKERIIKEMTQNQNLEIQNLRDTLKDKENIVKEMEIVMREVRKNQDKEGHEMTQNQNLREALKEKERAIQELETVIREIKKNQEKEGYEMIQHIKRVEGLREVLLDKEKALEEKERIIRKNEEKIEILRENFREKEKKIEEFERKNHELQSKIELNGNNRKIENLREEISEKERILTEKEKIIRDLKKNWSNSMQNERKIEDLTEILREKDKIIEKSRNDQEENAKNTKKIENLRELLREKERNIEEKDRIIRELKTSKTQEISEIINEKNREITKKTQEFHEKYQEITGKNREINDKYHENELNNIEYKQKYEKIYAELIKLKDDSDEITEKINEFQGKNLRLQEEILEKTQIINTLKARNKSLIREVNNKENIRDFDGDLLGQELANRAIFLIKVGLMMNFEGFSEEFLKDFREKDNDVEFLKGFIENTQKKVLDTLIYVEGGVKKGNNNNETKGRRSMTIVKNLEKTHRKNSLISKSSRIFEENKPTFEKDRGKNVFPFKGALYLTLVKIENFQYSFQTYFKASLNNKKTQVIPFVNNQNQGFFWELEIPEITDLPKLKLSVLNMDKIVAESKDFDLLDYVFKPNCEFILEIRLFQINSKEEIGKANCKLFFLKK